MSAYRTAFAMLVLAGVLSDATPAPAKILKTKRPSEYREFALTIGSGFEYEADDEETQYDFPFLVEYGVTEALTLTVEPDYVVIKPAGSGSISGLGDLETAAVFEFVGERRSRPALAAEALIKWPTATSDSLTTGETDFSIGAIISKEFVHFDLDSEVLYTFVGDPPGADLENELEISLAGAWHATRSIDVELEAVAASGGSFRGSGSSNLSNLPGEDDQEGWEYETTFVLSELLGTHLKLEEGVVLIWDGTWQLVVAWEWNFGEGD